MTRQVRGMHTTVRECGPRPSFSLSSMARSSLNDVEVYWRSRSRPKGPTPVPTLPAGVQIFVVALISVTWVFATEIADVAQNEGMGSVFLLYFSTSLLSGLRCFSSVRNAVIDPRIAQSQVRSPNINDDPPECGSFKLCSRQLSLL